ncbi:MAG: hypothetical protein WA634_10650 [Silvibacterium sp.]
MFARRYLHGYLQGSLLLGLGLLLAGCSSPSLVSIQVTPTTQFFGGPGLSAQLTAIGTYQQGNHPPTKQDITDLVTWKSNATAVATISSTGVVTSGSGTGSTAITASMNGFTGLVTATSNVTVCTTLNSTGTGCGS